MDVVAVVGAVDNVDNFSFWPVRREETGRKVIHRRLWITFLGC